VTDQPTISVIIPVYNGERFLAEAIQSVLDQTLRPDEIIVVDDGSTDETGQIVAGLVKNAPVPIRYICQANSGPSIARNAGVHAAVGDLLAFLDADDIWLPTKLNKQVHMLHEHPELGYVGCHVRPQLVFREEWPATLNWAYWESQPPSYTSSALLILRSTWEQVGPFDPNRRLGEDADWVMRARDAGVQAAVVSEALLVKHLHDRNLSHQAAAMGGDLVAALHNSLRRKKAKRPD